MTKLIIYYEEGKLKSIGTNPKCTDEEINQIAQKLVPQGIEHEIITEEEYNNIQEVMDEKESQNLEILKLKKKEELRQAYIDSQISESLSAVDNATTEEELNNI